MTATHYQNQFIEPVRQVDGAGNPVDYGADVYSLSFAGVAVTAAQDVFEIVAPADKSLAIRKIILGQYTDFGDAAAEILSVQVIRGYTTTGSGGSAVTPAPFSGSGVSSATAAKNNTSIAANGSPVTVLSDTFNIAAGYLWSPSAAEFIIVPAGARLVVRITAPADSLTMNATLIFEERA